MSQMSHKSSWLVESIYTSVLITGTLIITSSSFALQADDGGPKRSKGAGSTARTVAPPAGLNDALQPLPLANAGPSSHAAAHADQAAAPQVQAGRSALQHLASLTPAQRGNASIEIEPLRSASAADRAAAADAAALWNAGQYDESLTSLAAMEGQNSMALGITWRQPPEAEGGIAGFGDTTINTDDAVGSIALDVHKASGNLYCVVQVADGWQLFRSANGGTTWTNPYSWVLAEGIRDVDAAVAGNLIYVGYVAEGDGAGDLSDLRVRRSSANTGDSDAAYGFVIAHDASPATIEEIAAVSNAEETNNNVFFAALESDDAVGYLWDAANDGTTWTEVPTGFTNAESGLDATWNPDAEEWFLFLSYVGNDSTIKVARRASLAGWDNITVEPAYDGVATATAISAWQDTVIVGHRDAETDGYNLRYRVSYDGGDGWFFGDIFTLAPATVDNVFSFDVTARGGFGTAAVYVLEEGDVDSVFFSKRDGYTVNTWDAPVQINHFEPFTSTAIDTEINWIAAADGSSNNHRFGIVYDQPDPIFDRRQQCDGDVNESGEVDVDDLLAVITGCGACPACPPSCNADIAPFSGNCAVDVDDMLEVIGSWGVCP